MPKPWLTGSELLRMDHMAFQVRPVVVAECVLGSLKGS